MKRTILLITIILCIVVFITTMIAGIVLTITTIGWNVLLDSNTYGIRTDEFVQRVQDMSSGFQIGPLTANTIDETKTDSLEGIDTIILTVVSEQIRITDGGTSLSVNLKGNYRSNAPLGWSLNRSERTLRMKIDYPRWGYRSNDLAFAVQIPQSFKGRIEIHSVSGDCALANRAGTSWSTVSFTGVSGSLTADTADWAEVEASTVSGTVNLAALMGTTNLKSISGAINAAFKAADVKNVLVDTVSGSVTLALPESAKFSVVFDTISGTLDSTKFPLQIASQVKRRIEASHNGGGSLIAVKTISGSLWISAAK
jgi:hypothetical protein